MKTKQITLSLILGMTAAITSPGYADTPCGKPGECGGVCRAKKAACCKDGAADADRLPVFDTQKMILSNGVTVYLNPCGGEKGQVRISGWLPGGTSVVYTPENAPDLKMLNDVVAVSPMGGADGEWANAFKAQKHVRLGLEFENTELSITGVAPSGHTQDMLRLLGARLGTAEADSAAYNNLIASRRKMLERSASNPVHAMADSIHAYVFSHHPLTEKISLAELDRVDPYRVLDIYRERTSDLGDLRLIIAGDFNVDSVIPALERYIGTLPSSGRKERARDIGFRYTPGKTSAHFSMPISNGRAIAYTFLHSPCDFNLYNYLHANISGTILKDRITSELKEKRGWLKGGIMMHCAINGGINGDDPADLILPVNAKVEPGHETETLDIIHGVIERYAAEGPTPEELAPILKGFRDGLDSDTDDPSYRISVIKNYVENGFDSHGEFPAALGGVTAESLREFAKRYLSDADRIDLIMSDSTAN